MAKRKRKAVVSENGAKGRDPLGGAGENVPPENPEGLTEYELQRLQIIQRNRERLLALGLPSLMKEFKTAIHPAAEGPPRPKKKQRAKSTTTKAAHPDDEEPEGPAAGTRRSRRIKEAAEHPAAKQETAEERFKRQLGEFVVSSECPKCGRVVERNHRAHLRACGGPKPSGDERAASGYSAKDRELLAELSEADRKDAKKRALARTKALELSGLVDFTPDAAKFIVLGSKGDPYTITLADEKHKCTCLDHRFRRHNCKHILLVLNQLGTLEEPSAWKHAVETKLDELVAASKVRETNEGPPVASPPRNKDAEMATKFL